jgi:thiol:disulfide interchange protein
MKNQESRIEPSSSPDAAAKACKSGVCPFQGRWGVLLWALVIGAVVVMQWPMLKGMYYRATSAEAPASAVAWRAGFDAALAESAKTGKPVLPDFTASWCPPCRVMKHDVWPDDRVAAAVNGGYVPVLVDVDDPQNAEVARRYGVRGIPYILVVDAEGRVLKQGAFMTASGMLDFLGPGA